MATLNVRCSKMPGEPRLRPTPTQTFQVHKPGQLQCICEKQNVSSILVDMTCCTRWAASCLNQASCHTYLAAGHREAQGAVTPRGVLPEPPKLRPAESQSQSQTQPRSDRGSATRCKSLSLVCTTLRVAQKHYHARQLPSVRSRNPSLYNACNGSNGGTARAAVLGAFRPARPVKLKHFAPKIKRARLGRVSAPPT